MSSCTTAGSASPSLVWPCTVSGLEQALFGLFPSAWAEPWDHVGRSVGDPASQVRSVAVALDPSWIAIRAAHDAGANVLVTHHPICLDMPDQIAPESSASPFEAASIWEAISDDVALIAMHTNLDRSVYATSALPTLLGLDPVCGIEAGRDAEEGRLGSVADLPDHPSLDMLAQRCLDTFGRVAQVFGEGSHEVHRAAFFTGSIGDCGPDALREHADVVICGECGYHRALDLVGRRCAVIILGHDVSELPLVDVLAEQLVNMGVPQQCCIPLKLDPVWHAIGAQRS